MDRRIVRKLDTQALQTSCPRNALQIVALIGNASDPERRSLEQVNDAVKVGKVATGFDTTDAVGENGCPADFLWDREGELVGAGF